MWNYRVIKTRNQGLGKDSYNVHEVYYDDNGNIEGWLTDPIPASGESVSDLNDDLQMQMAALEKPVLVEKKVDGKLTITEI